MRPANLRDNVRFFVEEVLSGFPDLIATEVLEVPRFFEFWIPPPSCLLCRDKSQCAAQPNLLVINCSGLWPLKHS